MNRTFQSTLWQVGDKVIAMLVNLLVGIYLARALGPAGYGALAFILAVYAMSAPIAQLGLNALVTRELVRLCDDASRRQTLLVNSLFLRMFGASIAASLLIAFAWFGGGFSEVDERWGLTVLALSLLPFSLQGIEFYFHATMRHGPVARLRIMVIGFFALCKLIAVTQGAGLLFISTLFAIEYSAIGLGMLLIVRRDTIELSWRSVNWSHCRSLLRQSLWLILSSLAAIVYLKVDQAMLSMLVGHTQTGVYSVAVRLSEVWYFVATAAVTALFPTLLQLRERDLLSYYRRLQQVSDILCWSAVGLSLLMTFAATGLVTLLFGQQYMAAAPILVIHIWASVFVFMRALISKWILAEHLLWASLVSHGLGALINLGLNFWLIPLYGGIGAAAATILSYAVAAYLAFFILSQTRPAAMLMTRSLLLPLRIVWQVFPFAKR